MARLAYSIYYEPNFNYFSINLLNEMSAIEIALIYNQTKIQTPVLFTSS